MIAPIALQLYTVRSDLAKDFDGVIQHIAEIGYVGVEPAGYPGTTPQKAGQLFKSLGLQVPSIHSSALLGDNKNEALDIAAAVGCQTIVIPWIRPELFRKLDDIRKTCDQLNEAYALVKQNKLKLAYHNHDFEFQPVEGKLAHEWMRELLDPAILFELDVYWIQTAGVDAAQTVKMIGQRAPLLHIKDGPAKRGQPMVAVGDGVVNIAAIIEAGEGNTEWQVVELDECATDMMQAVEKSYHYLTEKGLARGKAS
jgi:sugar phosphate isomerase/epimerase